MKRAGTRILMDGKGRRIDNIYIERLWRSLKCECVYLHAWETGSQAKSGYRRWRTFTIVNGLMSPLAGKRPLWFLKPDLTRLTGTESSLIYPGNFQPMGSSSAGFFTSTPPVNYC